MVRVSARPSPRLRLLFLALIVVILAIYQLPPLLAYRAHGVALPPLFAPDLSLYLNLSNLHPAGGGAFVNPWYGTSVPGGEVLYRKFGLSFAAFHLLWLASGKSWFASLLLWNLAWTAAIALCGLWLVRVLAPRSEWLAAAGLALLMVVDLRFLPTIPGAWLHLPHVERFAGLSLPFIRSFFPQVSIPLFLLYATLLIGALAGRSHRPWMAMAVLQALAFALYPYSTLLMAGATAVAIVIGSVSERMRLRFPLIAAYALACALLDFAYLLVVGSPTAAGGASRTALIHLDPGLLFHLARGKTFLLVVALTIAAGLVRDRERPAVRAALVGLGATAAAMLVADAIVSPGLQVAHHTLYLVHVVLALLLVGLADALSIGRDPRLVRWASGAALVVFVVHGALSAYGTFAGTEALDRANAAQATALRRAGLTSRDLVLARAEMVDDFAAWAPLVSPARVLYCRNAEFVLAPDQQESAQLPRQAIYLYLTGRDAGWVDQVLSPATPVSEQDFLAPTQSRLLLEGPDRVQALADLRRRLDPLLAKGASADPEAAALFGSYDRVLVVDSATHPFFTPARLDRYLRLIQEVPAGDVMLRLYQPLAKGALH